MNPSIQRKGDGIVVHWPSELTKAEAKAAGEQLLKLAAEPERPAPKYKEGDCFVETGDRSHTVEITGGPVWDGRRWAYRCLNHPSGHVKLDWNAESAVDLDINRPCPRHPPEHPTHVPTGEVREPKHDELFFGVNYPDKVYRCTISNFPLDHEPFGRRRHIAREKQATGTAYLDTLKVPCALWFRHELYFVMNSTDYLPWIRAAARSTRFCLRTDNPREWKYVASCFQCEPDQLSAATVEVIDLGVPHV